MAKQLKVIAIVQARMSSSRLPGKVLMPLGGLPVIYHVTRRSERANLVDKVVVATSTLPDDDEIYAWCENNRVSCFRGSLDDVLGRYYGASQAFDCDAVVRITADCPVIDPTIIDELINFHAAGNYDYSSLSGEYPDGLDCCIFSKEALASSHVNATHQYEREHVGPYIESNPDKYKSGKFNKFEGLEHHRWTLDEPEDLEFLSKIFDMLMPKNIFFDHQDILNLLNEYPMLLKINNGIIRNQGLIDSLKNEK